MLLHSKSHTRARAHPTKRTSTSHRRANIPHFIATTPTRTPLRPHA